MVINPTDVSAGLPAILHAKAICYFRCERSVGTVNLVDFENHVDLAEIKVEIAG